MSRLQDLDDLPTTSAGKRVLVRVDLNVPMDGASVTDDTRLRALLPTVLELSDRGAIVLLLSHFGRPKGEIAPRHVDRAAGAPADRCSAAARCASSRIARAPRPSAAIATHAAGQYRHPREHALP